MTMAGAAPCPLGEPFQCILPGHAERRPSASWKRSNDGRILYHDFHARSEKEWLSMGEVFHALTSGVTKVLKPFESAQEVARLSLQLDLATPLLHLQRTRILTLRFNLPDQLPAAVSSVFETVADHALVEAVAGFH